MTDTISIAASQAVLAIAVLLPLINPVGVAPIFLSLTPGASERVRTTLALRIARGSFVLLVAAMLVGSYVLLFFGLSLAVVKIAGGVLVISTAWHLIRAEQTPDAEIVAGSAEMSHARLASRGFYPLTFPLTVGPGSLSVALTLGAEVGSGSGLQATWGLGAVVGIALVASTIYLCYRFASRLLRALGTTGSVVLLRMSAFILLAVGVKILCDGLVERFVGAQ